MFQLTMDLKTSSQVLGIAPEAFLEFAKQERLEGIIKFKDGWRVSIFALAQILNTTPDTLLEFLEDYALGQMLKEVKNDEWFEGEEGKQVYSSYLGKVQE